MKASMKKILFGLFISLFLLFAQASSSQVQAAQRVRGYYKSSGTYVKSYYRSNKDSSFYNNYSTKGNRNPYTGKIGTKTYKY